MRVLLILMVLARKRSKYFIMTSFWFSQRYCPKFARSAITAPADDPYKASYLKAPAACKDALQAATRRAGENPQTRRGTCAGRCPTSQSGRDLQERYAERRDSPIPRSWKMTAHAPAAPAGAWAVIFHDL